MKKIFLIHFSFILSVSLFSQQVEYNKPNGGFKFTEVKDMEPTAVKNQASSSTCWSFSTLSFFESELKRMGKGDFDLSEMFVVRNIYAQKAVKYVRLHGSGTFAPGGAFHDPLYVWKNMGIVPESAYPALLHNQSKINHNEVDELLKGMVDAVIKNKNGRLSPAWQYAFNGALDSYFGKLPESFVYDGKTYTPRSFADMLGLKPADYVDITSFTHHPFYSTFVLEIPDNWSWDPIHNLPLDEMMQVLDNALMNGYTAAWGADVSDKGFSHKNGVAIVPTADWDVMTKEQKDTIFNRPLTQKKITQELRQQDFDNYETTDDHGMQIVGLFKDQLGNKYYKVKNSWGENSNECGGYFFASESYVRLRSINIMVHKDAIPEGIRKKMNLSQK